MTEPYHIHRSGDPPRPQPLAAIWRYARRGVFTLDRHRIVGILNVTPDSFSDGGRHASPADAVGAAEKMVAEGADMLDVGGESTRPGASAVPSQEQIRRVVPVIQAIRNASGPLSCIPISIDTTLSSVARVALSVGADAINDVSAGTDDPAMFALAAELGSGLILMHRAKPPTLDRYSDQYADQSSPPPMSTRVTPAVVAYLTERSRAALAAGIPHESLVLDPGLGFGKTVEQNLELMRESKALLDLGFPLLSALSLKSFVGRVSLGRNSEPYERLPGSIAFSIAHLALGARLFRVHDVGAHAQALRAAAAILMGS